MIAAYQQQHPQVPVSLLCTALEVNRSWFYARDAQIQPTEADVALRARIEEIVLDMPGYGYRRVTEQLHREGWCTNHKKVLRIRREGSLLCQIRGVQYASADYVLRLERAGAQAGGATPMATPKPRASSRVSRPRRCI